MSIGCRALRESLKLFASLLGCRGVNERKI